MTAETLIKILQCIPPESVVQIQFYDTDYESPRIQAAASVSFKEQWSFKGEIKEPNRIVLS